MIRLGLLDHELELPWVGPLAVELVEVHGDVLAAHGPVDDRLVGPAHLPH